jgi:GNAT superfamily N-acetyltransferase
MGGAGSAPIGYVQATSAGGAGARDRSAAVRVHPAGPADARQVAAVIAEAFLHDPTWSWAFPDPSVRMRYWQVCIAEALRYPWVFRTESFEAASIWIPPDGSEFSPDAEARLPQLLTELVGSRAADVAELMRRFGAAHPRREPHYYLSLLGTADGHRGRGLGMALLRENLARTDAVHMPVYLESSNPKNNHLYEAVGFVPIAAFQAPGGGPTVTGMWRAHAGGSSQ